MIVEWFAFAYGSLRKIFQGLTGLNRCRQGSPQKNSHVEIGEGGADVGEVEPDMRARKGELLVGCPKSS